jgi:hypothetical protein
MKSKTLTPTKPKKPSRAPRPDTGSLTTVRTASPNDGVCGFLKVSYAADGYSATRPTGWRYRLNGTSGWSQEIAVGTKVELTGACYYDIDFLPTNGDTVVPDPKLHILVNADEITNQKLKYTP